MRTMKYMETFLLPAAQVGLLVGQFSAIYQAAFAGPPYNRQAEEVAEFARGLPSYTQRPEFRCAGTLNVDTGEIVGFAYGYCCLPGQWWYDNVARGLGSEATFAWLSDAFQVAEVAVMPAYQGRGVGSSLHDLLLAGVTQRRAVLSTLDAETVAHGLYCRRGWQVLLRGFRFPGVSRLYQIMGLDLHSSDPKVIL